MKELASCVAPISGEHLISESVIDVLKGDAGFSISGVPWLAKGEEKTLGANSLRANCLCKKHNSALSPIDAAAGYFFGVLKTYLEADIGEHRHSLMSGHDLERWLLKTAKALAASGNLARGKEKLSGAFAQDEALIAMLDDPLAWPEGAGLYCLMNGGDLMVNHPRFQLLPWTDEEERIVALEGSILGLTYLLLLEPPDTRKYPRLTTAKYRPGRIAVSYPRAESWLTFSWEDRARHEVLRLQFVQKVAR